MKLDVSIRAFVARLCRANYQSSRRRIVRSRTPLPQVLEQRLVLSAVSVISGVNSQIVFLAGAGETNDVVVSEAAGVVTIRDNASPITSVSAEYTIVSANEVTIPAAGFFQMNLTLLDGNDSLNASGLTAASGLRRSIIQGGAGNDTLVGSGLDDFFIESTGSDSIDGLTAISVDQWSVVRDADMTLDDSTLTIGTEVDTYANVEAVNLSGGTGTGDNTFDASATTTASGITGINFNGAAGDDTLIGGGTRAIFRDKQGTNSFVGGGNSNDVIAISADANMSVSDSLLTVGSSTSTHSGVERVDLTGGVGDNIIDASGITISGGITNVRLLGQLGDDTLTGSDLDDTIFDTGGANTLDGRGGNDLLILQADVDQSLTNTTATMGTDTSTHANFERISLIGGNSANVLNASALDASSGVSFVLIQGLDGNDTLLGSQVVDEIRSLGGCGFKFETHIAFSF